MFDKAPREKTVTNEDSCQNQALHLPQGRLCRDIVKQKSFWDISGHAQIMETTEYSPLTDGQTTSGKKVSTKSLIREMSDLPSYHCRSKYICRRLLEVESEVVRYLRSRPGDVAAWPIDGEVWFGAKSKGTKTQISDRNRSRRLVRGYWFGCRKTVNLGARCCGITCQLFVEDTTCAVVHLYRPTMIRRFDLNKSSKSSSDFREIVVLVSRRRQPPPLSVGCGHC